MSKYIYVTLTDPELLQEYLNGKTLRQLADYTGSSPATVMHRLSKYPAYRLDQQQKRHLRKHVDLAAAFKLLDSGCTYSDAAHQLHVPRSTLFDHVQRSMRRGYQLYQKLESVSEASEQSHVPVRLLERFIQKQERK